MISLAFRSSLCAIVALIVSGCATTCLEDVCSANHLYAKPKQVAKPATNCAINCGQPVARVYTMPPKFYAVGYGSEGNYSQYTVGQKRLMAMRSAEVDAYRKLAEQINGFRISGNTTVSSFAVQNDFVRTYVEAYIRGARITSLTAIADGNYQANIELDMTERFADCIVGGSDCSGRNIVRDCGAGVCESLSFNN